MFDRPLAGRPTVVLQADLNVRQAAGDVEVDGELSELFLADVVDAVLAERVHQRLVVVHVVPLGVTGRTSNDAPPRTSYALLQGCH
jgi:hypothetical protein